MFALIRHAARRFATNPGSAVFLAFGWGLCALLMFIQGQFMAVGEASFTALFTYAPWVLALLVPALTMGLAEASRKGHTERLLTLPFTAFQRFGGPFGFQALLLGGWVLGLWPCIAIVFYLGKPDVGPLLTGLPALWILGCTLLGLNTAIASRSRTAVSAVLVALGTNTALLLPNVPMVEDWLATLIPPHLLTPVTTHLPLAAFTTLSTGDLTASAFCTLLFWSVLATATAFLASPGTRLRQNIRPLAILAGIMGSCAMLALLPATAPWQADATADGRFTLSPATHTLLKALPQPVTFTLYTSPHTPDAPAQLATATRHITTLLQRMRTLNPSHIRVNIIATDTSLAQAYAALSQGIDEQPLPNGTTYLLGLTVQTPTQTGTLNQLDIHRTAFQELDILTLLTETLHPAKPTATLFSSNPGLTRTLTAALSPIATVEIPSPTFSPSTSLVILAEDPLLTSTTLAALQSYLHTGGHLMLLANPLQPAPEASATALRPFSSLLPAYGLTLNTQGLVADASLAALARKTSTGTGATPFWLTLTGPHISPKTPFTADITTLLWPESTVLERTPLPEGITLTPLLTTSGNAHLVPAPFLTPGHPPIQRPGAEPTPQGTRWLAALATGALTAPSSTLPAAPGMVMVFGSSQWLMPGFAEALPYQNLTFFTNSAAFLLGEPHLSTLRTRTEATHPLTRIVALTNTLTRHSAPREQLLETQLDGLQTRLTTLTKGTPEYAQTMRDAFNTRHTLRALRQQSTAHLRMLENALILLATLTMPLLMGLGFLLVSAYRNRP